MVPWFVPQHVKGTVEPSQCLFSYEHELGLLISWYGPQHVRVESGQCLLSMSMGLTLIPWCGPQHLRGQPVAVGVLGSECRKGSLNSSSRGED